MRYEVPIIYTIGRYAKHKAAIPYSAPVLNGRDAASRWVVLEAASDEEAFMKVTKILSPGDKRPISGKSYMGKWRMKPGTYALNDGKAPLASLPRFKMGDRVVLHSAYQKSWTDDGRGFATGEISEVVSDTYYSIALDRFNNRYVDFTLREFAPEVK